MCHDLVVRQAHREVYWGSLMTDATTSSRPKRRLSFEWLGVAPFIIFAVMFLILPTLYLIGAAFVGRDGQFTFDNIAGLFTDQIMAAYWISIRISGASAILGALIGLAVALALIRGRLPSGLRSAVMTFSGVASNFAGVPLAFAFISTVGRLGLVTIILKFLGVDIYKAGFNLLSFWGLTLTYLYFQIPLMILIIATAYALTGSSLNIVPILLYAQIRGDALQNPGLGAALALGMILITAIANIIYLVISARAERWMK